MQKVLRVVVTLALLFEAAAFFLGAILHLGVPIPLPFVESESLRFAVLEAAGGGILLFAFLAVLLRKRNAWKIAVVANVVGVAIIAYVTIVAGPSLQSSHHQPMLILLIVVLAGLSIPRCRQALENGRHGRHGRRRRKILQGF